MHFLELNGLSHGPAVIVDASAALIALWNGDMVSQQSGDSVLGMTIFHSVVPGLFYFPLVGCFVLLPRLQVQPNSPALRRRSPVTVPLNKRKLRLGFQTTIANWSTAISIVQKREGLCRPLIRQYSWNEK
jgi:hypothetical protein